MEGTVLGRSEGRKELEGCGEGGMEAIMLGWADVEGAWATVGSAESIADGGVEAAMEGADEESAGIAGKDGAFEVATS
jgi:hypothetical protein